MKDERMQQSSLLALNPLLPHSYPSFIPLSSSFPKMSLIEIENLNKSYRVYQKQEGLLASLRGLFHRE